MKCWNHSVSEGKHRFSNIRYKLHFNKKKLSYQVNFYDSCIYETKKSTNQLDINKLFGLSYGYHHRNSARFGWRSTLDGKIEILAYVYRNGKRVNEWEEDIYIETIEPNKDYIFELSVIDGNYTFLIKSGDSKKLLGVSIVEAGRLFPLGYYLNPYFGGDETAPQKMYLTLCEL